jgi:tRNA-specific 2-thiouridylase
MWNLTEKEKKKNAEKTVVVGMSGGVDSSVSALILKEQGYKVIGLFMKNWDEKDENGVCQASKDYKDVVSVCEKIGIPYYSVEFIEEYKKNVFQDFLKEYESGYTPNPDVLCNREIKFKVFFEKATKELGADYLATGHYCQSQLIEGKNSLVKGMDKSKDQSYFLYTIKSEILEKVLFPIGGIEKKLVRELAQKYDLSTKYKKDSTGICFIGERNFKKFLGQYIHFSKGLFKTLDGEVVGEHTGSSYYTLGQRKGLGLGGPGKPWFVLSKDIKENIVYVGRGEEHPALFTDTLTATEPSWVGGAFKFELPFTCKAKVRYRQLDQDCTIESIDSDGRLCVHFEKPQRAVTPRQSIVFYQDETCLGGAMIERPGVSYYERGKVVTNLNKGAHD